MRISKSILYMIVILSLVFALPFIFVFGLRITREIIQWSFHQNFLWLLLFFAISLIPIFLLLMLIKLKEGSESYNKISTIIILLGSGIVLLVISLVIMFFLTFKGPR